MKNAKCFGIVAIGFCLLFISTYVSAEDSPQPPWRTAFWPALSSTQWYWYEPETNLTVEQVEAIFGEVAATNIHLIDSRAPGINITVKNIRLEIGKPKKGNKADNGSLKPEPVAIENPPIPADATNQELTRLSLVVVERLKYTEPGENVWNAKLPERLKLNVKGAK